MRVNVTFVLEGTKLLVLVRHLGNSSDAIQLDPAGIRGQLRRPRPGGWALITIKHPDSGA